MPSTNTLTFACPDCDAENVAGVEEAGTETTCRACGSELFVPAPIVTATRRSVVSRALPISVTLPVSDQKACAFCGEAVLAVAKKCKHCGETLDVGMRAAEEALRAANRPAPVYMNAGGGAAASSSPAPIIVIDRRGFPHAAHIIMTILTVGLWTPIYLIHYLARRR